MRAGSNVYIEIIETGLFLSSLAECCLNSSRLSRACFCLDRRLRNRDRPCSHDNYEYFIKSERVIVRGCYGAHMVSSVNQYILHRFFYTL